MMLGTLLLWKGIVPAWKTLNTDFPNYYLVARLLREHYSLGQVYDWIWLQRIKDHWGIPQALVGFPELTPPSAWPVLPLTFFSALTAKRIWIVLNVGMLAACAELLHRSTLLRRRFVWLMCLLAIVPLRNSFLFGQMHLLVVLLMVMAWFFYQRKRDVACGVCIALASALKVYPLLFVGYFVLKRRWNAAVATLVVTAVVLCLTEAWMGREILHVFIFEQLPRTLQGEVMDPYSASFGSGASLFHRLLLSEPQLNPSPYINSPALYAVLYPLWQMILVVPLLVLLRPSHAESDGEIEYQEWAAMLLALLALTPVPSTYHFVALILPVVLLLRSMLRDDALRHSAATIVLYTSIGLVGGVRMPFASTRFWLVLALYALSLSWLLRLRVKREIASGARDLAIAMVLGACGLAFSAAGYSRHFAQRDLQLGARLEAQTPTLLATSPTPADHGVDYIAMQTTGYRIARMGQASTMTSALAVGDQLSLTQGPDNDLLIEVADSGGSRIVRGAEGTVLAVDAESPTLSPDGQRLAYIREVKGRGTLRLALLSPARHDVAVTSPDFDVRQVAFRGDGALLFVASHEDRFAMFLVTPSLRVQPYFAVGGDIAAFAVSPDDHFIAFTESIRHRWQLAVLNTLSKEVVRLTAFDCNAYRPAWSSANDILYATDCGRGLGLTALATAKFPR